MKRFSWFAVAVLAFFVVGCGGPGKKSEEEGYKEPTVELPHDHLSESRQGVIGADGTKTSILDDPDYEALGLKVFPGAEPGRDKAAYVSEGDTTLSTKYVLFTEKSVEEVAKFYEEELNAAPSILNTEEALISGKIDDEFGAVVSVFAVGDGSTEIQIEVLRPVEKE